MKRFLSAIGKILGFIGKAGTAWGQGLALLEPLAAIIALVQAMRGPGDGQAKRAQAIEMYEHFLEVEGIVAKPLSPALQAKLRAVVGSGVDFAIDLGKVIEEIKAS